MHTLCVGNAWGEAALLLSSGKKGCRSALPSSSLLPGAAAQVSAGGAQGASSAGGGAGGGGAGGGAGASKASNSASLRFCNMRVTE